MSPRSLYYTNIVLVGNWEGIVQLTFFRIRMLARFGHIWPEKTYVYDVNADGTLTNKKEFANMRTDGMTTDTQGNIYLTNENGCVAFDKNGVELDRIPTFEGWTANCVFGDTDRKTLFITAMGALYGVRLNVAGVVK